MPFVVLVLVLALILGGLGFAVKVLWYVALAVLIIWLLGFLFRSTGSPGGPRPRWYRW